MVIRYKWKQIRDNDNNNRWSLHLVVCLMTQVKKYPPCCSPVSKTKATFLSALFVCFYLYLLLFLVSSIFVSSSRSPLIIFHPVLLTIFPSNWRVLSDYTYHTLFTKTDGAFCILVSLAPFHLHAAILLFQIILYNGVHGCVLLIRPPVLFPEKYMLINPRKDTHTHWIASDRVMCVHTLPWGKALTSTNACNQSGSARRRRN